MLLAITVVSVQQLVQDAQQVSQGKMAILTSHLLKNQQLSNSNAESTTCVPLASATTTGSTSTSSTSFSVFGLIYTVAVFAIFYQVTEYLLEKIEENMSHTGALLKITLVVLMILVGQILPIDADNYLLAYVCFYKYFF